MFVEREVVLKKNTDVGQWIALAGLAVLSNEKMRDIVYFF
jgi:hypothetical protein